MPDDAKPKLVSDLSPVNSKGLHQGQKQMSIHAEPMQDKQRYWSV